MNFAKPLALSPPPGPINYLLQKTIQEWLQAFGTTISGIVRVDKRKT